MTDFILNMIKTGIPVLMWVMAVAAWRPKDLNSNARFMARMLMIMAMMAINLNFWITGVMTSHNRRHSDPPPADDTTVREARRQIHNPGDLIPIYVTADAARMIHKALRQESERLLADAREATGELAAYHLRNAERYQGLSKELATAFDHVPSVPRPAEADDQMVVGFSLFRFRAAQLDEDLEELRRRGELGAGS